MKNSQAALIGFVMATVFSLSAVAQNAKLSCLSEPYPGQQVSYGLKATYASAEKFTSVDLIAYDKSSTLPRTLGRKGMLERPRAVGFGVAYGYRPNTRLFSIVFPQNFQLKAKGEEFKSNLQVLDPKVVSETGKTKTSYLPVICSWQ